MNTNELIALAVRWSGRTYRDIALAAPINYYRLLRLARGIAKPRPDEMRRLAAVLPVMTALLQKHDDEAQVRDTARSSLDGGGLPEGDGRG